MSISPEEMKKVMGGIIVDTLDFYSQNPGGLDDDEPMKIVVTTLDFY